MHPLHKVTLYHVKVTLYHENHDFVIFYFFIVLYCVAGDLSIKKVLFLNNKMQPRYN